MKERSWASQSLFNFELCRSCSQCVCYSLPPFLLPRSAVDELASQARSPFSHGADEVSPSSMSFPAFLNPLLTDIFSLQPHGSSSNTPHLPTPRFSDHSDGMFRYLFLLSVSRTDLLLLFFQPPRVVPASQASTASTTDRRPALPPAQSTSTPSLLLFTRLFRRLHLSPLRRRTSPYLPSPSPPTPPYHLSTPLSLRFPSLPRLTVTDLRER
jgi:hypothetical protein